MTARLSGVGQRVNGLLPDPQATKTPGMGVIAYILASGILGVAGQITLKRGLATIGPLTLTPDALPGVIASLALNPLVILGLAVTVSGTFFWLITLSRVDLSFAYPFASLNYVLILATSWWLLDERVSMVRLLGVLAICLGVCLVMRTPARSRRVGQSTDSPRAASWRQTA